MATKPELKRAIANTKIKASDYNFNFDKLNDYIENGIADNAINFYEPDRAYKKGQWVMFTGENGSSLYESLIDGNKGNSLTDNNFWVRKTFGFEVPLLQSFWSDHILNRPDLLRADTFSWQSGKFYEAAYNELVSEYDNENSVEETEGGITFKRTPNGYKIADISQETAILDKYNTDGIAWYYILDKDNTQFKLPRTKFGFEGLRDNVGNDIQAGLPNIRGSLYQMWANSILSDGATIKTEEGTSTKPSKGSNNSYQVTLDASLSSSIYGNSNTVQPPATQMYLYFYVGNYTQTALEQTAGINTELFNNKADKTELDGKLYVVPDELISLSKATAIGVYEKDLSNIIPNDGYEYEMELLLDGIWSTGLTCHADIKTSILSNEAYPPMFINVNSSTVRMTQTATVPIGVDRTLTLTISNAAFNTFNLNIFTYRRIGNRG